MAPNHFDLLANLIEEVLEKTNAKELKILDIGGGAGEYWLEGKRLSSFLSRSEIQVTVLDAQIPSFETSGEILFKKGEAPRDLTELDDGSFDLVIAFDIIEHLKKEDGYLLLYAMERIAGQACFMFTPNGFVYQRPEVGNPFNAHISGWHPNELENFGWGSTRGHSGLKSFFGVYGLPKRTFSNVIFHNISISLLLFSQLIVFRLPSQGFAFSSKKEITQNAKSINLSRINQEEQQDV